MPIFQKFILKLKEFVKIILIQHLDEQFEESLRPIHQTLMYSTEKVIFFIWLKVKEKVSGV